MKYNKCIGNSILIGYTKEEIELRKKEELEFLNKKEKRVISKKDKIDFLLNKLNISEKEIEEFLDNNENT